MNSNSDEIFHELKESEDERIRKTISDILLIDSDEIREILGTNNVLMQDIVAWLEKQGDANKEYWTCYREGKQEILDKYAELEKQGEQKPYGQREECSDCQFNYAGECKGSCSMKRGEQKSADKVEPKFKVGDWVVDENGTVQQILSYKDCIYKHTNGYSSKMFEDVWRMWDIAKDAKKGDVLFYRGNVKYSDGIKFDRILLFENLDTSFFVLTKYSNGIEDYGINENIDYPDNIIPATKEQKEILFMVMKEVGYEWDSKHKQLKKN